MSARTTILGVSLAVAMAASCGGDDDDDVGNRPPDASTNTGADAQSGTPDAATAIDAASGVDGSAGPSFLFAADGRASSSSAGGNLYRIDVADAAATTVGPTGTGITALALAPDGTLYATEAIGDGSIFSDGRHWLELNPDTGAATEIALQELTLPDLAFLPDGSLVGWTEGNTLGSILPGPVSIDLATGAHTTIGTTDVTSAGSGLAVDDTGTLWLAATRSSCDGATLFSIDTTTGLGTEGPTLSGCPAGARRINSMAFHRGVLYGVTISAFSTGGTTTLVTIDRTTGAVTTVGELPVDVDAIASGDRPVVAAAATSARTWQLTLPPRADATACPNTPSVVRRGRAVDRANALGSLVALAAPGDRRIRVVPCTGAAIEYDLPALARTPDRVHLRRNRRGATKLVDGARTVARGIARIELLP